MNEEQQKIIQEQTKVIDDLHEAIREIGDFADGLNNVLMIILEDAPEGKIVKLTLEKIMKIVEQNI